MRSLLAVATAAMSLCLAAWDVSPNDLVSQKITNVERVVISAIDRYTLLIREPGSTNIQRKELNVRAIPNDFFVDVPPDTKPWVLLKKDVSGKIWSAEFHVRSRDDVEASSHQSRDESRPRTEPDLSLLLLMQ